MKRKHYLIIFSILISTTVVFFILNTKKPSKMTKAWPTIIEKVEKFPLKIVKKYKRLKETKRAVANTAHTIPKYIKKRWEEKAVEKLSYTTLGKADIRIEFIGNQKLQMRGFKKRVKKAKVFMVHKESGKRTNFFALLDPLSGSILKTWGATRHENFLPEQQLKLRVTTR
jgi:hypothetical protein